jgi:glycerol-3-phosphate acyltransferase PlsY
MLSIDVIAAIIISYLFGSLSSAIIVCRLMGLPDPRTQGSRNPGATNVLRFGGKKAAAIALLGDALKGFIPVLAAKLYGIDSFGLALVMLAAFLGHLFPLFFRFEGGKGVATLIGCLLALSWPVGLCWMATWLLVAMIFRYSSLASLIASALAPLYVWSFTDDAALTVATALMAVLLIYRHRDNIAKLLTAQEDKIGKKA